MQMATEMIFVGAIGHKTMITQLFFHLTKSVILTVFQIPIVALLILHTLYTVSGFSVFRQENPISWLDRKKTSMHV